MKGKLTSKQSEKKIERKHTRIVHMKFIWIIRACVRVSQCTIWHHRSNHHLSRKKFGFAEYFGYAQQEAAVVWTQKISTKVARAKTEKNPNLTRNRKYTPKKWATWTRESWRKSSLFINQLLWLLVAEVFLNICTKIKYEIISEREVVLKSFHCLTYI